MNAVGGPMYARNRKKRRWARLSLGTAMAALGALVVWLIVPVSECVAPKLVASEWRSTKYLVVRETSAGTGDWLLACETLGERMVRHRAGGFSSEWLPTTAIYRWQSSAPNELHSASATEWSAATGPIGEIGGERLAESTERPWPSTGGGHVVSTGRAMLKSGTTYVAVLSAAGQRSSPVGFHFAAGGETSSGPHFVDVFKSGRDSRRGRRIRLDQSDASWSATDVCWLDDVGTIVVWASMDDENHLWIVPERVWDSDNEEVP